MRRREREKYVFELLHGKQQRPEQTSFYGIAGPDVRKSAEPYAHNSNECTQCSLDGWSLRLY